MSKDPEHFGGGNDDPLVETPQNTRSWIETTLVPKLRERLDTSIRGNLCAPYIFEEYLRPVFYTLSLVDTKDEIEIHGDAHIDGISHLERDQEEFVVTIRRESGAVNVGTYSTPEPALVQTRILWILYAAADLWNLLPVGAKVK